jgi:hypothetical protein
MVEIDWNIENTQIICKLLVEQVERGNHPNTYLSSIGYAEVDTTSMQCHLMPLMI